MKWPLILTLPTAVVVVCFLAIAHTADVTRQEKFADIEVLKDEVKALRLELEAALRRIDEIKQLDVR